MTEKDNHNEPFWDKYGITICCLICYLSGILTLGGYALIGGWWS